MKTLSDFKGFTSNLRKQDQMMPVLFIGHGSPMNGIEHNQFSNKWAQLAKEIPEPAATLAKPWHENNRNGFS